MAAATDAQMQQFANERVRVRAEQARELVAALRDDRTAIDDIYARAVSNSRWTDARTDGPPTLMQSGNSANPDHMLVYNTVAEKLLKCVDGTATLQDIADLSANWPTFMDACVRGVDIV